MILRNMMMGGKFKGLLDDFPGAIAAFSLRGLVSNDFDYTSIQIRRASDASTFNVNINHITGEIDEQGIIDFVAPNDDATVVSWFDQSSQGNHVNMFTSANQPFIARNGQLVKVNGKLAVDFDATSDRFMRNQFTFNMFSNPHTLFSVTSFDNIGNAVSRFASMQQATATNGQFVYAGNVFITTAGQRQPNDVRPSGPAQTGQTQLYYMTNSPNFQIMGIRGETDVTETGTIIHSTMTNLRIGQGSTDTIDTWDGKVQEIIIYPFDMTTDRVAIEQDQADYYGL